MSIIESHVDGAEGLASRFGARVVACSGRAHLRNRHRYSLHGQWTTARLHTVACHRTLGAEWLRGTSERDRHPACQPRRL